MSRLLASDGATVAVLGLPVDRERTDTLRSHLNGSAPRVHFYEGDVGIPASCRRVGRAGSRSARPRRLPDQ